MPIFVRNHKIIEVAIKVWKSKLFYPTYQKNVDSSVSDSAELRAVCVLTLADKGDDLYIVICFSVLLW